MFRIAAVVRVLVRPQVQRIQFGLGVELAIDALEGPEAAEGHGPVGRGRALRDVHRGDALVGDPLSCECPQTRFMQRHGEVDVVRLEPQALVRRADAHVDLVPLRAQVRRCDEAGVLGLFDEDLVVEALLLPEAPPLLPGRLQYTLLFVIWHGEHKGHVPVHSIRILGVLGCFLRQTRERF